MRILYISSENVPGDVGGSVRTFELARALERLGHDVTIFTNRGSHQKRSETLDGVKIIRSKIKFGKTLPIYGIKRLDILRKDFDVVIERYSIFGGIGTIYSKLNRKPLVLEINAPHLEEAMAAKALKGKLVVLAARRWQEIQFRAASKIMTTKKEIVKGHKNKVVEITLGGVNPSLFNHKLRKSARSRDIRNKYGNGKFLVVFHGAFTRWHGILDLMNAAKVIEKRDKKIKFLLIGGGEMEEKAKSIAPGNCVFVGKKAYSDVPYYLAACDAGVAPFAVLPPHVTGIGFYWTPMKIFEYMSLRLPVITADYKELRAIVGKNGVFYKPGNYRSLAKCIMYARKKKIGVSDKGKYSWLVQAKKVDKILRSLSTRGT